MRQRKKRKCWTRLRVGGGVLGPIVSLDDVRESLKSNFSAAPLWPNTPSDPELRDLVLAEVARLTSRREANILRLRWFAEMSWKDICRRMRLSRQWAWELECRAIVKLKQSDKLLDFIRRRHDKQKITAND